MKKILPKIKNLLPSKRKLIQLYSALLFNANIKGFFNGQIYKGGVKTACAPGLNCYSCPGASAACPLGSLQGALGNSEKSAPYYVIGIIILYGILLGRFICGFLCPFGLVQELLYKIKTPKLKKSRITRVLSYIKYVILVFFVIIVPLMYLFRSEPVPAFCKYICPSGTIEGAFGLLSNKINESQLARLGPLFTWKFMLTVSVIVGSVFIFRVFCRFICPLGALYGLFNKFSILGIKLDKPKCTDCGLCISKCKMDIKHVGDHECISCGECISVCPTKAISFKGGKIILPPNEVAPISQSMSESEKEACIKATEEKNKKLEKRRFITRIISTVLMISLLAGALVYYNFIDKADTELRIYTAGELCPDVEIPTFNGTDYSGEKFNPLENKGKVTVLNFWYTQCGGCVAELPAFDKIASEYKDMVTVVAITKSTYSYVKESYAFINEGYADSEIIWGLDTPIDPSNPTSADVLFKSLGGGDAYPMTVILDRNGNIFTIQNAGLEYDILYMFVMGAYHNQ